MYQGSSQAIVAPSVSAVKADRKSCSRCLSPTGTSGQLTQRKCKTRTHHDTPLKMLKGAAARPFQSLICGEDRQDRRINLEYAHRMKEPQELEPPVDPKLISAR